MASGREDLKLRIRMALTPTTGPAGSPACPAEACNACPLRLLCLAPKTLGSAGKPRVTVIPGD